MPLSEFYRSVTGKNASPQQKATDISYIPNDEFVELVWERGQIMMQGQSSKARKTPVSSHFQFHTSKAQEKEDLWDVPVPGTQDDDIVPWLNYPLDDYCSDLLPEISGVTANEPSMHSSLNVIDKRVGCGQIDKDSQTHTPDVSLHHGVGLDQSNTCKVSSSSRTSQLFSWSPDQVHILNPPLGSVVSGIGSSNARNKSHNVIHRDSTQSQGSSGRLEEMVQKESSAPPYSRSGLLNFSHFSRRAAMAKASLRSSGLLADPGSCGSDMVKSSELDAALNVVNRGPRKEMGFLGQPCVDSGKVVSNPLVSKPIEESHCVEKSYTDCREDVTDNDKSSNVVHDANAPKGGTDTQKSIEPVRASSSVCSGNSAERASNDLTKKLKRKSRDTEDFECQSEDIEEESLGTKMAATSRGGTGSKRSRAAEVHNLSERRRRDRINEKMRALQELIPNCNKVDKASMLDEAIEYLKTLQLQVQIMSMGAGLCIAPMMFQTGMQPMHPAFSPMGIGMGMGYGMGMADMNGGSQGHPHMFPFHPSTQGPCHPEQGSFQGIPKSTLQVYGHSGQGMPPAVFPQPPMPRVPLSPPVRQMGAHVEFPDVAPIAKDPMQNENPRAMTQTSSQCQAANKSVDQSTSVEETDRLPETGCSTAGLD